MDYREDSIWATIPSGFPDDGANQINMIQACRFGWQSTFAPASDNQQSTSAFVLAPLSTTKSDHLKRWTPCSGRLYHQLDCSHRVRTDAVEDCGGNCLDPLGGVCKTLFYCQQCVENEATQVWQRCKADFDSHHPAVADMTNLQFDRWYKERHELEARFTQDRNTFDQKLKMRTRPSHPCAPVDLSDQDKHFVTELSSLSLSNSYPSNTATHQPSFSTRRRSAVPSDASEQLHWGINSLHLTG